MVVTATPTHILAALRKDFKAYEFIQGAGFAWSSSQRQIIYPAVESVKDIWSLLHEIAHAELGHIDYALDVELLGQEVAAWELAKIRLAPPYCGAVPQEFIEEHLDTYRQWLHRRSLCPTCQQNGFQTTQNTYSCSNCRCLWRVNEARLCNLQRVRLPSRSRSL
ncbi:MAG TPA: hypothetical protein VLG40_05450 [Candidatus Saccharimonas sp.]|nr:hypothetical protein [Candidatus Saccharimonas sp.]